MGTAETEKRKRDANHRMDKPIRKIKDKLTCKINLVAYFTEKTIGNIAVDTMNICQK